MHESLVDLFRHRPDLAAELLCRATDAQFPAGITARLTSAELVDLDPAEYRADVVVRLDDHDKPVEAIIVEVQLDRDSDKRYSWPLYQAGVRARFRCPTTLLVIAIDDAVAAWCARPIPLGRAGSVTAALVLGPRQLPRITDFSVAHQHPELAVLSAACHGQSPDAAPIAAAALSACDALDNPRASRYADFVLSCLGDVPLQALEKLMSAHDYQYQSNFARQYFNKGREAGHEAGLEAGREATLRKTLLTLLSQRFGPVTDAERLRIEAAEGDDLERWTERIIPAATRAEVFGDE